MQLTALLPVLALLASSSPAIAHAPLDRRIQHSAHSKLVAREETAHLHARAAERIAASVDKREGQAVAPRALAEKPRKFKRGASGCRARDAVYTPSASSTPAVQAAAASSTAAPAASSAAASSDDAQPSASASSNNYAADNSNSNSNSNSGVSVSGGPISSSNPFM